MARSWCTARSHAEPRPGVPRPSATTTAKPWSANHCEARWALCGLHDARAVRPAVRVEQHRQRRAVVVAGQQHGGGDAALAGERQRGRRRAAPASAASLAQLDAVERLPLRARLGERRRAHDDRAAAGGDARARPARRSAPRACRPASRRQTWIDVASSMALAVNAMPGAVDGGHGAHLQVGRRDRLAVDEQAAGAVAVGARHERAVGEQPRHAGHELDPDVVVVLEQRRRSRRSPGRRASTVDRPLVARLHGDDQAGVGPAHVGEVRVARRGPTRRRRSSRRGR